MLPWGVNVEVQSGGYGGGGVVCSGDRSKQCKEEGM